jgi:hypothetical protein
LRSLSGYGFVSAFVSFDVLTFITKHFLIVSLSMNYALWQTNVACLFGISKCNRIFI